MPWGRHLMISGSRQIWLQYGSSCMQCHWDPAEQSAASFNETYVNVKKHDFSQHCMDTNMALYGR